MAEAALAFSIARLAAPALELGLPDRFVLEQDLVQDALALRSEAEAGCSTDREGYTAGAGTAASPAAGFGVRVQADADHPVGGTGGGLLKLPQAFGSVYLGQVGGCCSFKHAMLKQWFVRV